MEQSENDMVYSLGKKNIHKLENVENWVIR